MLKQLKDSAGAALRPLAKKVVTPLLTSTVGDEVGTVRIAKRFAKQWAASAGLYDPPEGTLNVEPPASARTDAPGAATAAAPSARGPLVPHGEQKTVLLYTTRKHSSCKTARKILDELGIHFDEIDLSDDEAGRQRLYQQTSDRTFPQVYIDGKRLGGFDDLVVAREEGKLQELLYPSPSNA